MDEEIKISEEFILPRDLSAMAKTFFVVVGVKVIAEGEKIRDVQRLIDDYPLSNGEKTKAQDWYKCRGTAIITNGVETFMNCELHWYQCENIGKVEFKVKVWGDKVES